MGAGVGVPGAKPPEAGEVPPWSWSGSPGPRTLVVVAVVSTVVLVGAAVLMVTLAGGAGPMFAFPAAMGGFGLLFVAIFAFRVERLWLDHAGVLHLRVGLSDPSRLDVAAAGRVLLVRWRTFKTVHDDRGKTQVAIHHLAVLPAVEAGQGRADAQSAQIHLSRFPRRLDDELRQALETYATVVVEDRGTA